MVVEEEEEEEEGEGEEEKDWGTETIGCWLEEEEKDWGTETIGCWVVEEEEDWGTQTIVGDCIFSSLNSIEVIVFNNSNCAIFFNLSLLNSEFFSQLTPQNWSTLLKVSSWNTLPPLFRMLSLLFHPSSFSGTYDGGWVLKNPCVGSFLKP